MDDILLHAPTEEKLKEITDKVFRILKENGLKLNKDKCVFNQPMVTFLGHKLSAEGLHPDESKIEAIEKLQRPHNVKSLQRFLGMVNYLGKFIQNLSDLTAPLRDLLKAEIWDWTSHQENAFLRLKSSLKNPPVLAFYDVNKPVTMSVDSSSYAFGAVLLQEGRPVAYATKALRENEMQWPQIEKEAGAIRFACTKFHNYIWGKETVVETDHKPLETIFAKPLTKAPLRLRKLLHEVKAYDLKVKYVKGTNIPVADTLSRDCALETSSEPEEDEVHVLSMTCLTDSAIERYKVATANDPILRGLLHLVSIGWPDKIDHVPKALRSYFTFRDELSYAEGILFKGDRVIVPQEEISRVLQDIHRGHYGIQASLRRAREFLFWPGMADDITKAIEKCKICEKYQRANQKEVLFMKKIPELPFEIVATDLFNHRNRDYILMVDSYSGYFDFQELKSTSSTAVIEFLKSKFADHGVPLEVHSDGGPQYASKEFAQFAKAWNFNHCMSSPYFARSNGLAERYVQTAKQMLKKCTEDKQDLRLALLYSRNTPGPELRSPAERLFSRRTRNPLCASKNLLMPQIISDNSERLKEVREQQKQYADRGGTEHKKLNIGERVRVQERDKTWSSGVVAKQSSERSYNVQMDDGRKIWRNRHFIHPTKTEEIFGPPSLQRSIPASIHPNIESSEPSSTTNAAAEINHSPTIIVPETPSLSTREAPANEMASTPSPGTSGQLAPSSLGQASAGSPSYYHTRSGRAVKPVQRMNL
ncbi:uncharacterized protein DMENIID0001_073480 [Sergentomyia squamirostris]